MFAFVCTKHRRYLDLSDTRDSDGRINGLSRYWMQDLKTMEVTDDPNWLQFDTSGMWCPENNIDEVLQNQTADALMGPLTEKDEDRMLAQAEEADCARWYAVVDELGCGVFMLKDNFHPSWLNEFDIYEGKTSFDRKVHLR